MLHEDAAPVSQHKSAFVRSWSSMFGVGREIGTRFVLCTCMKEDNRESDLSWGAHPRLFRSVGNFAGWRLGVECSCLRLGLGLNLQRCRPAPLQLFKLLRLFVGEHFHASPPQLPPGLPWRSSILTEEPFQAALRRPLHPLASSSVFSRHTYRLDLLRLFDHHGVTSHVVANVFAMHLSGGAVLPGRNEDQRLQFLNGDMKELARSHQQAATPQDERRAQRRFPRAPWASGEGRQREIVGTIRFWTCRDANPTDVNKHALKVVKALQGMYDIVHGKGYFLSVDERRLLKKGLDRLGENY